MHTITLDGWFVLSFEFGATVLGSTFETAAVPSSCHFQAKFIRVRHGSSTTFGTGITVFQLVPFRFSLRILRPRHSTVSFFNDCFQVIFGFHLASNEDSPFLDRHFIVRLDWPAVLCARVPLRTLQLDQTGSLVQSIVFSTNQKVACLPSIKYNWLNTKYHCDGCYVTDIRRRPVIQPFVGRRMLTALPKRLEIEPTFSFDHRQPRLGRVKKL